MVEVRVVVAETQEHMQALQGGVEYACADGDGLGGGEYQTNWLNTHTIFRNGRHDAIILDMQEGGQRRQILTG